MPTRANASTSRISRTASALALGVALGLTGTVAASADIGEDERDASPTAAAPRVMEFPMSLKWTDLGRTYGEATGEPRILFDAGTRTVVLDVDIAPLGPVTCNVQVETDESGDRLPDVTWTEEEWSSDAPKTLPIPEGFVRAPEVGQYLVQCTSGAGPAGPEGPDWGLAWAIQNQGDFDQLPPADLGTVLVLTQDEQLLVQSTDYSLFTTQGPARTVSAGDVVRVIGPPGSWADAVEVVSFSNSDEQDQVPDFYALASASADGSTIEFTMPVPPSPDFFESTATVTITSRLTTLQPTPGNPGKRADQYTIWSAPLAYVDQTTPTSVEVSLSTRYALSFQRLTATAVVNATGSSVPTGTVSFRVNGKSVGTAPVGADGTAKFRLPALAKGRYSITTTFTPSNGSPTTTSPGAWLRVLR